MPTKAAANAVDLRRGEIMRSVSVFSKTSSWQICRLLIATIRNKRSRKENHRRVAMARASEATKVWSTTFRISATCLKDKSSR
jgi:hypothetical protein